MCFLKESFDYCQNWQLVVIVVMLSESLKTVSRFAKLKATTLL